MTEQILTALGIATVSVIAMCILVVLGFVALTIKELLDADAGEVDGDLGGEKDGEPGSEAHA